MVVWEGGEWLVIFGGSKRISKNIFYSQGLASSCLFYLEYKFLRIFSLFLKRILENIFLAERIGQGQWSSSILLAKFNLLDLLD